MHNAPKRCNNEAGCPTTTAASVVDRCSRTTNTALETTQITQLNSDRSGGLCKGANGMRECGPYKVRPKIRGLKVRSVIEFLAGG